MNIVFLVSGNGGNLKFVFNSLRVKHIKDVDIYVIADRECGAMEFARDNSIPAVVIKYDRNHNGELLDNLTKIKPEIIVTNWHKIIDGDTVAMFYGKLINLHYSLLPAFGGIIGVEPIRRAYAQGCKFIGATCHYVDQGVDTGRIVAQAIVKTDVEMDRAIEQVFRKGCLILLNTIIKLLPQLSSDGQQTVKEDFAPDLLFDDSVFDERFWEDLLKS